MTDTNDDEEKCVDGLGVIGRAKAGLRDPLRLLNRHPLRHRRHHHNYHCHRHHCFIVNILLNKYFHHLDVNVFFPITIETGINLTSAVMILILS